MDNVKMVIAWVVNNIALVSALVLLVAIFIAIKSNSIAKRSLRLSEKTYQESQSNFDLYYCDGFRITVQEKRLLLFNITVRNKSKSANSFTANLKIGYQREDDSICEITIKHTSNLSSLLIGKEGTIYPDDIKLDARESTTKWLIFEQPDPKYKIDSYCITFTDLDGYELEVKPGILKDIN